jgi:uncharacterized membrane protein YbaN (DUF454 family)
VIAGVFLSVILGTAFIGVNAFWHRSEPDVPLKLTLQEAFVAAERRNGFAAALGKRFKSTLIYLSDLAGREPAQE